MVDAAAEIRREKESSGGGTYIEFTKNRNGNIENKLYFQLTGTQIVYSNVEVEEEEEVEDQAYKKFKHIFNQIKI